MTLHAKIASVRAEFGSVEKTGEMKDGPRFKYVEAGTLASRFVELCTLHGLTMLPVGGRVIDRYPTISGKQYVTDLELIWRITDTNSGAFIDVISYGQGADNSDKALPKAQTNALKYAILMVLQKAGDDPERDPLSNQQPTEDEAAAAARARTAARRGTAPQDPIPAPVAAEVAPEPTPPATGTHRVSLASESQKIGVRQRQHELKLTDDELRALGFHLTGKTTSKEWTRRDADKVKVGLENEALVETFRGMKAVADAPAS